MGLVRCVMSGRYIVLAAIITIGVALQSASAGVFTVTNTNNTGAGSFRDVLDQAYANSPLTLDTIEFNIPGAGPHTIAVTGSNLDKCGGCYIDGYSQPGSIQNTLPVGNNAVLKIVIDGGGISPASSVLTVGAPQGIHSTLRGLVVNGGAGSPGAYVSIGSPTTLQGCFIGTDPTGAFAVGTAATCVDSRDTALIGGSDSAHRNVIGGAHGQYFALGGAPGSGPTRLLGNYIGLNAQGTGNLSVDVPRWSIAVTGQNHVIGGLAAGERNVIGPADDAAIHVGQTAIIRGNYIGTDATGMFDAQGGTGFDYGIHFDGVNGAGSIVEGNLISGFVAAAFVSAPQVTFVNNMIGTNAAGQLTLPNGTGIRINTDDCLIGGVTPGEGNLIAGNGYGIYVGSTFHRFISILGNQIWGSTPGIGIDLAPTGVTPNDAGDSDDGPNGLQNYPVITEALTSANQSTTEGTLNSKPDTEFRIECFYSGACHPSGYGEAQLFLGAQSVTTDGSGNANFSIVGIGIPAGGIVTATATDPDGNTSEFSACMTVLFDEDEDGIADINDNCISDANPGQEDADNDNIGDACDAVEFTVYSPVDIVVYAPDSVDSIGLTFNTFGARASYDDQTDYGIGANGIPGEPDDRVVILAPVEGVYTVKIITEPGGSGDYYLGIRDPGGNSAGVADGGLEQFVAFSGGSIFLSDTPVANPVPSEGAPILTQAAVSATFRRGDLIADATYDILDVIETINHAFRAKPLPDPVFIADVNSDGIAATVLDVVRIIETVFRAKPVPGP